jgi:uncharacterized protein YkwD
MLTYICVLLEFFGHPTDSPQRQVGIPRHFPLPGNEGHVAPLLPSKTLDEASAAASSGLDPLYAEILQLHNTYRAKHCAPPLEWSARLASEAADYAKLCKFQHDPNTDAGE